MGVSRLCPKKIFNVVARGGIVKNSVELGASFSKQMLTPVICIIILSHESMLSWQDLNSTLGVLVTI